MRYWSLCWRRGREALLEGRWLWGPLLLQQHLLVLILVVGARQWGWRCHRMQVRRMTERSAASAWVESGRLAIGRCRRGRGARPLLACGGLSASVHKAPSGLVCGRRSSGRGGTHSAPGLRGGARHHGRRAGCRRGGSAAHRAAARRAAARRAATRRTATTRCGCPRDTAPCNLRLGCCRRTLGGDLLHVGLIVYAVAECCTKIAKGALDAVRDRLLARILHRFATVLLVSHRTKAHWRIAW